MSEQSAARPPGSEHKCASYGESAHYDARYWAWQNQAIEFQTDFRLQPILPHVRPSDTVLDFGCAGGTVLAALPASRKIGVELNDLARESAQREFGLEVHKRLADVPDHVADVVISSHTLEHLEAPIEALRQLRTKIKPGGKLVLVLPIDSWRHQQAWNPDDINHHLYTWTPLLLGNALHDAGFVPGEMRVLRRTLFRRADRVHATSPRAFVVASAVIARLRQRQELVAVAAPAS